MGKIATTEDLEMIEKELRIPQVSMEVIVDSHNEENLEVLSAHPAKEEIEKVDKEELRFPRASAMQEVLVDLKNEGNLEAFSDLAEEEYRVKNTEYRDPKQIRPRLRR